METKRKKTSTDDAKILIVAIAIIVLLVIFAGATFAYFAFNASNNNVITGEVGTVNLSLNVSKVLPNTTEVDDILVTNFSDMSDNLNNKCLYTDGEFATCQLYKVVLTNNADGVNTKISGSVSFNNTTTPNLSWLKLDNYDPSTTYTAATLGTKTHKASSTFTKFVDGYLLKKSTSVTYYLLVWVNESETEQADDGAFTGTVKFEDQNGKGVTSTFGT